jgi:glycosyltransferase involved in cell wall biosynthesis
MRLAAYVDAVYFRDASAVSTPEAFPIFTARVGRETDAFTLLGRLHPQAGRSHHELPPDVEFVPLPFYEGLDRPLEFARGMAGALLAFWRVAGRIDVLFLPGPHPLALLVAPLAALRRTRVVLGVRQNTREYALHRHPNSRAARLALYGLEAVWRAFARVWPVATVGPEITALYSRAPRRLQLDVSMVAESELAGPEVAAARSYDGDVTLLSVGRLETEKNPLMLADVLAELHRRGGTRFKLAVCGEGPLKDDLARRLEELGVAEHADLLGYVAVDGGLMDLYRSSHLLLHTSWTEGLPQILFEAFAARLPVVASDVGGVRAAAGDAALLIEAGDVEGAADSVERLAGDAALRERLIERGAEIARGRTMDAAARELAAWMRSL